MADSGRLSPRKRRAIAALMSAKDSRSAAQAAGVGERTLYRWLGEPAFKAGLESAEAELAASARRELWARLTGAIEKVDAVMRTNKPSDQLRAAQTIIDYALKFRDMDVIEQRLAALEALLIEQKSQDYYRGG